MPTIRQIAPLVVAALRQSGGAASTLSIRQVVEGSVDAAVRAVQHGGGPGTELGYRVRWAILDLRQRGVIERTGRGTYRLLEAA